MYFDVMMFKILRNSKNDIMTIIKLEILTPQQQH